MLNCFCKLVFDLVKYSLVKVDYSTDNFFSQNLFSNIICIINVTIKKIYKLT